MTAAHPRRLVCRMVELWVPHFARLLREVDFYFIPIIPCLLSQTSMNPKTLGDPTELLISCPQKSGRIK